MGESVSTPVRLRFDGRLRLEFTRRHHNLGRWTPGMPRVGYALELTGTTTACLQESRGGRNVQHQLVPLLRQSVYSRLAGYKGTNDAERQTVLSYS